MVKSTLIIVGPGGVGKGPLANLIREDAVAIDPYRLRPDGPRRDSEDPFYAHSKLRTEVREMLISLGDSPSEIQCENEQMEWFRRAKVLFFTVRRDEWQFLILHGINGDVAKAELYAPVLPAMLRLTEIHDAIGATRLLVLNPASKRLADMSDWGELETKTEENCKRRGDQPKSIEERKKSISVEAPAWRTLVTEHAAIEVTNWPFPEYRFNNEDKGQLLRDARSFILRLAPDLENFFKPEDRL